MKNKKTLRLLLTRDCNRNCIGCCNNDLDLDSLPEITSFVGFNEVIITGGEPMLFPSLIIEWVSKIRTENPGVKLILYTAHTQDVWELIFMVGFFDGVTITIHDRGDVCKFNAFINGMNYVYKSKFIKSKSLRLNVFDGINIDRINREYLKCWSIKDNVKWIKNCPLPKNETFGKIPKCSMQS